MADNNDVAVNATDNNPQSDIDSKDTDTSTELDTETNTTDLSKLSDEEILQLDEESIFGTQEDSDDSNTTESSESIQANESSDTDVNYEEVYKQIFKPFKANGKEITPKSVEDVVSLMQMGSNYEKKMAQIKPMRKIAKSLEKANIGEEEVNFLIDVYKGNSEAVKKLLKKLNIDPYDLDVDEINYNPSDNMVTEESLEFGELLDDLKTSPHFSDMYKALSTEWDAASRYKILGDKNLLTAFHNEFSSGRFRQIQDVVDYERAMGRLKGLNDLDAYVYIQKDLESKQKPNTAQSTNTSVTKNNSKYAAQPTKGRSSNSKASSIKPSDLLKMSDEEFSKLNMF